MQVFTFGLKYHFTYPLKSRLCRLLPRRKLFTTHMALVEQLLRRVDYQVNKNWGRHPTLGINPTHLRQGRKSNLKTSSSQNKRYISFLALYTARIIYLPPDFDSPLTLNNGGLIYTKAKLNKEFN